MKYLLIIGDGMADNPVPELGGRTPLQAAQTPHLDRLAAAGEVGSVTNCPEGLPPGSDTAILSIFGCDPWQCYTGRAPLEAAADGIALSPGDAAYRCNMVCVEEGPGPLAGKKILSHSAGSIEGDLSAALVTDLFANPRFRAAAQAAGVRVYPAKSFRHIAVQARADLTGIRLTPPHDHLGELAGPWLPDGCDNAEILADLMEMAHKILSDHIKNKARRMAGKLPANCIWFWAEGTAATLPDFTETFGVTGGVISAVPLCHGIARLVGLEPVTVEGATGELDTNYEGKVAATLEVLGRHNFACVHVEAPDECTHNGDLPGKIQAIELLDRRVVGPLVAGLEERGEPFRVLVLSDHKTLTATRGHDGDPVPYLLYDSRRDTGGGLPYDEDSGAKGPYHPEGSKACMQLLLEQR